PRAGEDQPLLGDHAAGASPSSEVPALEAVAEDRDVRRPDLVRRAKDDRSEQQQTHDKPVHQTLRVPIPPAQFSTYDTSATDRTLICIQAADRSVNTPTIRSHK